MNCPHCGCTISENTPYCSHCGKLLPAYLSNSVTTSAAGFQKDSEQKSSLLSKLKISVAVAFTFYFILSSFFIIHYICKEAIKNDIEICSEEITFYLNSLDMKGLSQYITEESQQIINNKLFKDANESKKADEFFNDLWKDIGKDVENPEFLIKIVKSALAQINWADFHVNLHSADISIWQKKVIVHSELAGQKIDLAFVKEGDRWLLSLSEKDIEIFKNYMLNIAKELK